MKIRKEEDSAAGLDCAVLGSSCLLTILYPLKVLQNLHRNFLSISVFRIFGLFFFLFPDYMIARCLQYRYIQIYNTDITYIYIYIFAYKVSALVCAVNVTLCFYSVSQHYFVCWYGFPSIVQFEVWNQSVVILACHKDDRMISSNLWQACEISR